MNWQDFFEKKTRGGYDWEFVGIARDVKGGPWYIIEVYKHGVGRESLLMILNNDGKVLKKRKTEFDLKRLDIDMSCLMLPGVPHP